MDRGTLIVSLDFELHWGVRDKCTVADYKQNLLGVRDAVPRLLDLFAKHDIHATWATVGFLFCEDKEEMLGHIPQLLPQYTRDALNPYRHFKDVGENERSDPFHFAPSLIRQIMQAPGQELGTHTFSHYYCLETGQTAAEFRSDLNMACRVAQRLGIALRSIVFPRNQINPAYLPICSEFGITSYRGTESSACYAAGENDEATRPTRRIQRLFDAYIPVTGCTAYEVEAGVDPVNLRSSRFLRPYSTSARAFDRLKLRRICSDMKLAAIEGKAFHLWWHPHNFGTHTSENLQFLERILTHFARLRHEHGMQSCSMLEAAAMVLRPECHA